MSTYNKINLLRFLSKFKKIILNFLFPKFCLYCLKDQKYDYDLPLCSSCLNKLDFIDVPYCKKCGIKNKNNKEYCSNCLKTKEDFYFEFSRSVLMFNPYIRVIIHHYKYKGLWILSNWLGNIMANRMDFYREFNDFNILIPIPLSKSKKIKRGYNQSSLLAKQIAIKRSLIFEDNCLIKIKGTESQASLNQKERIDNIKNSFKVINIEKIKGKNIIIIDDVATTLSTLKEASLVLKQAGANRISCYTLARE